MSIIELVNSEIDDLNLQLYNVEQMRDELTKELTVLEEVKKLLTGEKEPDNNGKKKRLVGEVKPRRKRKVSKPGESVARVRKLFNDNPETEYCANDFAEFLGIKPTSTSAILKSLERNNEIRLVRKGGPGGKKFYKLNQFVSVPV